MSSSSSSVLRFKGKAQHSGIICPCGAKTVVKQSESTANPGRCIFDVLEDVDS
ncbi:hypothetical protein HanRHA438_Chr13g0628891 [Helianthus annuus]|nr:hypothetical protein HanRHA438_Chr13g0628891 [Helianthus annuus]